MLACEFSASRLIWCARCTTINASDPIPSFGSLPMTSSAYIWGKCARTIVLVLCMFADGSVAAAPTKYENIVNDPPRSPQEQLKAFHLPPGFEIQLVAADPD